MYLESQEEITTKSTRRIKQRAVDESSEMHEDVAAIGDGSVCPCGAAMKNQIHSEAGFTIVEGWEFRTHTFVLFLPLEVFYNGLCARTDMEFFVNTVNVGADGFGTDKQFLRNLFVAVALREGGEDFLFTGSEVIGFC
jgi:hypothetical protein